MKINSLLIREKLSAKQMNNNYLQVHITSFNRILKYVYGDKTDIMQSDLITRTTDVLKYINDTVTGLSKRTIINSWLVILKEFGFEHHTNYKQLENARNVIYDQNDGLLQAPKQKELDQRIYMADIEKKRDENKLLLCEKFTKQDVAYLVLSLYTMLPPMRGEDYFNSMIYVDSSKAKIKPGENYCCIKQSMLFINKHKTVKDEKIGVKNIAIPIELLKIIKSFNDKSKSTYLICTENKKKFSQSNFSHLLKTLIGCSTSMIRKIYDSDVVIDGNMPLKQRKEVANIMGHSLTTQTMVYSRFSKLLHKKQENSEIELLKLKLSNYEQIFAKQQELLQQQQEQIKDNIEYIKLMSHH